MGCSAFSISVFSFHFSEVCKIRTSLRCDECPHHMASSGLLGNDSTTLCTSHFGVHSSNCVGGPRNSGMLLSSWVLHSPLSWDPLCLPRVFSFLLSISYDFLFLGLLSHFGGDHSLSSSFLRSDAWEVNTFHTLNI